MGVTGPGGMYMPSSGGNQPTNQTILRASGVPSMAGQSRLTSSTGGRPHTMPITPPSPTPGAIVTASLEEEEEEVGVVPFQGA